MKKKKHEPPVPVSPDERGRERSEAKSDPGNAQAPDGVSGDWG